jgi:hypothetical protein
MNEYSLLIHVCPIQRYSPLRDQEVVVAKELWVRSLLDFHGNLVTHSLCFCGLHQVEGYCASPN